MVLASFSFFCLCVSLRCVCSVKICVLSGYCLPLRKQYSLIYVCLRLLCLGRTVFELPTPSRATLSCTLVFIIVVECVLHVCVLLLMCFSRSRRVTNSMVKIRYAGSHACEPGHRGNAP